VGESGYLYDVSHSLCLAVAYALALTGYNIGISTSSTSRKRRLVSCKLRCIYKVASGSEA
jgi:hypothetical protein